MRSFLWLMICVLGAIGVGVGIEAGTPRAPVSASDTWTIATRQPALRLVVAEVCPKTVARYHDVINLDTQARVSLVPPNPHAGLICRYGTIPTESDSLPYALVGSARLGPTDAGELALAIDRVSTKRPVGVSACPAQFESATVIAFSYTNGTDADIWYDDSGCASIDNGFIEVSELANPAFSATFVPLVAKLAPRPGEVAP